MSTKTRTITLTDRPPVTIREDDWPVIALAKWWEGEHESQASRSASIRVREHQDGRRIVYAVAESQWQHERGARAGYLIAAPAGLTPQEVATGDEVSLGDQMATVRAIHDAADTIGHPELAAECIADLPAEALLDDGAPA